MDYPLGVNNYLYLSFPIEQVLTCFEPEDGTDCDLETLFFCFLLCVWQETVDGVRELNKSRCFVLRKDSRD